MSFLLSMMQLLAAAEAAEKVKEIVQTMLGPTLMVLGGAGVIYMIVMGVQYAKADDDAKRTEIKKRLINLGIGIAAIFILATLCLTIQWDAIVNDLFGYAFE